MYVIYVTNILQSIHIYMNGGTTHVEIKNGTVFFNDVEQTVIPGQPASVDGIAQLIQYT